MSILGGDYTDDVEIAGDDTPALQAVLDADVWRKHLLREQDVCFTSWSLPMLSLTCF
jgi:hypothetical protein